MHVPRSPEGAAFVWSLSDEALLRAANALYGLRPAPLPADVALAAAWLTDELVRRTPGLDEEIDRVLIDGFEGHYGAIVAEALARLKRS